MLFDVKLRRYISIFARIDICYDLRIFFRILVCFCHNGWAERTTNARSCSGTMYISIFDKNYLISDMIWQDFFRKYSFEIYIQLCTYFEPNSAFKNIGLHLESQRDVFSTLRTQCCSNTLHTYLIRVYASGIFDVIWKPGKFFGFPFSVRH